MVKVTQDGEEAPSTFPLVIDDSVPKGSVVLASGIPETASLGASYGRIELEQAKAHD